MKRDVQLINIVYASSTRVRALFIESRIWTLLLNKHDVSVFTNTDRLMGQTHVANFKVLFY